jgi:hypothetical protein
VSRMPRLLTAVSIAALLLTAAACGGGGSGDQADSDATPAPTSSATPAAPAAGFVTVKGADWSFSRPEAWTKVGEEETEKGKESEIFQSEPGTDGIPSQVGIGTASDYKPSLRRAVMIGKDIDETRFPTYEVTKEGPLEIQGAEGYKIDATYDSFTDQPIPIRIVNIYVQTPARRQMNFFVRGPETDLQALGLEQLVDSFRVLPGKSGSQS